MTEFVHRFALLAGVAVLAGCATSLTVHEVKVGASGAEVPAHPDGILLNKRAVYSATYTGPAELGAGTVESLAWVDSDKMLSINICRYPFATGKLTLGLNNRQQAESIEISGSPGLTNAITAASEALTAKKDLEKDEDASATK